MFVRGATAMFETYTGEIYSPDGLLRPNERRGQMKPELSLSPGTLVFSTDSHIELATCVDRTSSRIATQMWNPERSEGLPAT